MAIPIYGAEAHGGRIITLDDEAVVKDLANASGVGGNDYEPFVVPTPFDAGIGGWSTFRRATQHVHAEGNVTVEMTPIRDEQDTGQTITRTLSTGDDFMVGAPFKVGGTTFQLRIVLKDFDSAAELGKSEQWIVPRRRVR